MYANFSGVSFELISYERKKRQHHTQAFIRVIFTLFLFVGIATPLWAQLPAISHLSTIQTAEPMGKGGSSTTFGILQYSKVDLLPDLSQRVDIGGFEESHRVTFQIETFLVPVRFTYGLSDELDLVLGGTFSTGGVRKVVHDFYNTATETSADQISIAASTTNRCLTVLSGLSITSNRIGMITSPVSLSVGTHSSGSLLMIGSIRTMSFLTIVPPMGSHF